MPALVPKAELGSRIHEVLARAPSPSHLISTDDIKNVFSDALLSFSPLATLVGADSARALADRVTNFKQSFVACIAPVGALGMMATVAKGTNLTGIKEMLGVGGQDIKDAACALGCAAVAGDVIPRMDEDGGMVSNETGHSLDQAACAIVRQKWQTGPQARSNLERLRRVPATFVAGAMSGRLMWEIHSQEKAMEMIRDVQQALSNSSSADRSVTDVFDRMNNLKGGKGTIEIHWPGPAMPLETKPIIIYLYGCFFAVSFVSVAFLAGSRILLWQSPISSGLLVGGQILLILGHVAAQYAIKYQRETLRVWISVNKGAQWSMIDKTRFTSVVARRPLHIPRRFLLHHHSASNDTPFTVTLGQYHRFRNRYISTWHALLTLSALTAGFISFYVGGKSSSVKTVAIYIVLFILANLTKGPVVLYANKPHYTRLNNFGHQDIVLREHGGDSTLSDVSVERDHSGSSELMPSTEHDKSELSCNSLDAFPKPFCIYSKFFVRDRHATDMFSFSSTDEWILAAHVISKAVKSTIQSSDLEHTNDLDDFLQIPLYLWNEAAEFRGLLLLAIDQIRPEHLFWSVGMEIVSSLMGNFCSSSLLCSEDKEATNISFLAAFVYTCVRMLLSEHVYCGNVLLPCKLRGARSLMRAIDDTTSSMKNPPDTMPGLLALLSRAAEAASGSKGVILKSKKMLAYEDVRFSRLKGDGVPSILTSLKKLDGCMVHLRQVEQLVESRQLVQLPLELRELRDMLTQLMDVDLGASVLQVKDLISRLPDKLHVIGDLQVHRRKEALWEEAQEELKDELRELGLVQPYWRMTCWQTQEILRCRQRQRPTELQQELLREEAVLEELRWGVHCWMAQLGASLREQQSLLREQLRQELRRELLSVGTNGRQQQLEQEIDRTKRNVTLLQQELKHRGDIEEPEEYMMRLHQLEFQQIYLEQELQEMVYYDRQAGAL